jgi:hypothetical protein
VVVLPQVNEFVRDDVLGLLGFRRGDLLQVGRQQPGHELVP